MIVLEKKFTKKIKHNCSRNLKIVLKELQQSSDRGGVSLEYLALKCGVSTRQIYRYLNELQNMGYDILKSVNQESDSKGGYTLKGSDPVQQAADLQLINMLGNLESIKDEILSAKLFIKEFLLRVWLNQLGIVIPLTKSILSYNLDDAITVSRQTVVFSNTPEEPLLDVKLKVSAKAASLVAQSLNTEVISRQRQKDGNYIIQLKTKRVREMSGVLMQWGSAVEVLEPSWLRHKMVENCKAILYASRQKNKDRSSLYTQGSQFSISY